MENRPVLIPSGLCGGGDPCPALPICELVGNARKGCMQGGGRDFAHVCLAGLILLTARGQGLYTKEMEEDLQKRQSLGFGLPKESA